MWNLRFKLAFAAVALIMNSAAHAPPLLAEVEYPCGAEPYRPALENAAAHLAHIADRCHDAPDAWISPF